MAGVSTDALNGTGSESESGIEVDDEEERATRDGNLKVRGVWCEDREKERDWGLVEGLLLERKKAGREGEISSKRRENGGRNGNE